MDPRRAGLETETLYEVSKVLSLSTDLNKAFTSALSLLGLYLGMENGTLSLFDPVTGEVFIEAAPEMVDAERILGRLRPGEGIVGRIFATGLPVVIPDVGREPLFLNRTGSWRDLDTNPRAFIGVPVQDGRAVLGWATVHGLAMLLTDGLLPLPATPEARDAFVADILRASHRGLLN